MLNIYKASAGSGKTFCLTLNYIKLLLQNWKSETCDPENYKHILAVTFTNKATGEMKSRILSELNKLANNEPSDFLSPLMTQLKENENTVRGKAKTVLKHILHNYSHFSVSTIDKFFQQVIRAFVREIGIQGGYQVELDNERILQESADLLFTKISEDKNLFEWLKNYAEEKVSDDKDWDLSADILKFAKKTFNEKHSSFEIKKEDLKMLLKTLNETIAQYENDLKAKAEYALSIITKHGLTPDDFSGKSRSPFRQLTKFKSKDFSPTKTFFELPDNIDKWTNQKSEKYAEISSAYSNGLNNVICEICEKLNQDKSYQSALVFKENIRSLGILTDISEAKKELLQESNTILLSDSNLLLKKIIDNSDTPFVYEKIGTQIHHFMIDEFQDTSETQWENFRPLIQNSLSYGNNNLIVGDVKQSIYRWRNSDWNLLANKIYEDISEDKIRQESLDCNFRSKENIVKFNNIFFEQAKTLLYEKLKIEYLNANIDKTEEDFKLYGNRILSAYENIKQNLPPKKQNCQQKGHVKFEFVTDEKFQESVLERLPEIVNQLQEKNYQPKDIAFLVRKSDDGQKIADFFLQYKQTHTDSKYRYDVISNDSLSIAASPAVSFIVWMLKYITFHNDALTANMVSYYYNVTVNKLSKEESITHEFPQEIDNFLEKIKSKPLFELTEEIIGNFKLGEIAENCAYLQCFQDIVFDFAQKNNNDIKNFLNWWNENGRKKKLATSENQDAMRIITIHKSKGLDFKAVIIPFCSWEMKENSALKQPMLWTSSKEEPFDKVESFPIKYSSKLQKTYFSEDYWEETLQEYIDNLNLIYVAFTRARNEMIVFTNNKINKNGNNDQNNISNFVKDCISSFSNNEEQQSDSYELGVFEEITPSKEARDHEMKMQSYRPVTQDENSNIKMKLHSTDYFSDAENKINTGKLMHSILQRIYTQNDVEKILSEMTTAGLIAQSELEEIRQKLNDFFKLDGVSDWFSGKYKVLNETDILVGDGNIRRPDRILIDGKNAIVIDYKFGEKESDSYIRQVSEYMKLVNNIGYQTSGYICFCKLGKIVKV